MYYVKWSWSLMYWRTWSTMDAKNPSYKSCVLCFFGLKLKSLPSLFHDSQVWKNWNLFRADTPSGSPLSRSSCDHRSWDQTTCSCGIRSMLWLLRYWLRYYVTGLYSIGSSVSRETWYKCIVQWNNCQLWCFVLLCKNRCSLQQSSWFPPTLITSPTI